MKLQPDRLDGVNVINAFTAATVSVNGQAWSTSVVVPWRGSAQAWPASADAQPGSDAFDAVLALSPEVVIYGSGPALRFPPPASLRALMAAGIGVETMDTAAACRTYNVLATEGRRVVAALVVGAP